MINNDTAYEAHMKQVDAILTRRVGFTHEEGFDTDTRSRFEQGMTPESHAEIIIEEWEVFC